MRKAYKSILSLAVVLIAGLNIVVPAFAQDPFTGVAIGGLTGASGAGLFGSMAGASGIDIAWSNQGSDQMDAMWNVLNPDHVYFSGEKHEADPQTDPEDVWDYITVDLEDWLSAQSNFIVQFAQEYNVTDNSSGTTETTLQFDGYPFTRKTDNYNYIGGQIGVVGTFPVSVGGYSLVLTRSETHYNYYNTYYNGSLITPELRIDKDYNGLPIYLHYYSQNTVHEINFWYKQGNYYYVLGNSVNINLDSPEAEIWTSGTVNTHVFDGWENAKVKIPHNISGLPSNWTIPDFTNALNNLWDQGLQGQIIIEDTDQPVPPPPVPTTPLGDVPFDDWVDLWGQGIYQQLENQSDALDFIGSNGEDALEELESIDSNLDDLNETAESIDTNIGTGIGLLGGIKSGIETAVDFLEGIAEHVGELVEEIVEGTETLIAGILNQIPSVFGVIFGPIKQASSIWHYVVEWIQSITAPMSWMLSMANGTSYYIVLPVYASLAGAVVLAFYKRFGK